MDGFMAGQAAKLSGVNYAVLVKWDKSGFISPSVAAASGSGSERRYSFKDVVALRVARELRSAGVSVASLRKVVKWLREREGIENPLAEERLILVGDDVVWVRNTDELLSLLRRPGQVYFGAIALAPIVEELRAKIAA